MKKDKDGRRSVEAQIEVPGSPEEVWSAIATGPGLSSWFVPTTIDERVGGETVSSFGPGMDATSKITKWDPPQSFTAETPETNEEPGKVATEWTVEATLVSLSFHVFGEGSAAVAAEAERQWNDWILEQFPHVRPDIEAT